MRLWGVQTGLVLRLKHICITDLSPEGPSRTCVEGNSETKKKKKKKKKKKEKVGSTQMSGCSARGLVLGSDGAECQVAMAMVLPTWARAHQLFP